MAARTHFCTPSFALGIFLSSVAPDFDNWDHVVVKGGTSVSWVSAQYKARNVLNVRTKALPLCSGQARPRSTLPRGIVPEVDGVVLLAVAGATALHRVDENLRLGHLSSVPSAKPGIVTATLTSPSIAPRVATRLLVASSGGSRTKSSTGTSTNQRTAAAAAEYSSEVRMHLSLLTWRHARNSLWTVCTMRPLHCAQLGISSQYPAGALCVIRNRLCTFIFSRVSFYAIDNCVVNKTICRRGGERGCCRLVAQRAHTTATALRGMP